MGKKVRFTPMKVIQKWIWPSFSGYCFAAHLADPVVEAGEDANTAPSDST
jgi:hypothetical protein